jgi:hypothetical protein
VKQNIFEQPDRPNRIRATFETWIVRKEGDLLMREIPGTFIIEIRLSEKGRRSVFKAMVRTTLQEFAEVFPLSKLVDCKSYVRSHFKKQLTEWEVIEK